MKDDGINVFYNSGGSHAIKSSDHVNEKVFIRADYTTTVQYTVFHPPSVTSFSWLHQNDTKRALSSSLRGFLRACVCKQGENHVCLFRKVQEKPSHIPSINNNTEHSVCLTASKSSKLCLSPMLSTSGT